MSMILNSLRFCVKLGRRSFSGTTYVQCKSNGRHEFDESILKLVVCPLSKNKLRYDKENNELICDEIQVAYPIVNGIPNLIPLEGRKLKPNNDSSNHQK